MTGFFGADALQLALLFERGDESLHLAGGAGKYFGCLCSRSARLLPEYIEQASFQAVMFYSDIYSDIYSDMGVLFCGRNVEETVFKCGCF